MIWFVVPSEDAWCMKEYLEQYGGRLQQRVKILAFDQILTQDIPVGTYIFSAIDHLSPTEREIAACICRQVSETSSGVTAINHPGKVLTRYALLRTCFNLQRNTFNVYRAATFYRCRKFPVFIRSEYEHTGSLTPLLHTRRELIQGLARVLLRGYSLRDLIIVEYLHTADSSGIFREYCASIVDGRIIPQALILSRNWITKWAGRIVNPDTTMEQLDYVENNPHAEWLRATFQLANVGYGRIDYCTKSGTPQVWEINTNPMIVRPAADPSTMPEQQRNLLAPVRERFLALFRDALEAVDTPDSPRRFRIEISARQLRQLAIEKQRRSRRTARQRLVSRAIRAPAWLLRRLGSTAPR